MFRRRLEDKPLGQLLIEKGLITKEQLEKALKIQSSKKELLGQIMVSLGFVDEKDIAQSITVQYGYPYLPLQNYEFDKSIVRMIPEEISRRYSLVIIDKLGGMITVAMFNPLDSQAVEEVKSLTNCEVQIFVGTLTDIKKTIDACYSAGKKKDEK